MIPVESYAARLSEAPLGAPLMWSGHYAGDRLLGEITAAYAVDTHIAEQAFWLLAPFAYAIEVTESWLIFDGYLATGVDSTAFESDRVVYAARLREGATFWVVPYQLTDTGELSFGDPNPTVWFLPAVFQALNTLLDRKASGIETCSYDEACASLVKWL